MDMDHRSSMVHCVSHDNGATSLCNNLSLTSWVAEVSDVVLMCPVCVRRARQPRPTTPPPFDPTTHLATYTPEEMRQLVVAVVATTDTATLWSMLPPADVFRLLAEAPNVYGPWHPGDADDVDWQRTAAETPFVALVGRGRHGLWYWEGCGSDGDEHATADAAKAACDAHLRARGIVLVDP